MSVLRNSARHFKAFLLAFAFLLFAFNFAFAATSESYVISAEVIDLGGASAASTHYQLTGKLREVVPQVTTSSGYTLEGRFMGVVYGTGAFSTFETPVITSITPNQGYNTASYEVVIRGWNISSDATASLTAPSMPAIYGTNVTVETSTSMECRFDLTNADAGKRNVVVTNIGYGKSGSLAGGFTVRAPGKVDVIGTPVNSPNPVIPSAGPTMIKYKLSTSATITLYLFNQKGELIWQKTIPAGENGGTAGDNSVAWNAVSSFNEDVPTGVYILSIISRSGGETRQLSRIKIAVLRR
jgi:hypothetical protein